MAEKMSVFELMRRRREALEGGDATGGDQSSTGKETRKELGSVTKNARDSRKYKKYEPKQR